MWCSPAGDVVQDDAEQDVESRAAERTAAAAAASPDNDCTCCNKDSSFRLPHTVGSTNYIHCVGISTSCRSGGNPGTTA